MSAGLSLVAFLFEERRMDRPAQVVASGVPERERELRHGALRRAPEGPEARRRRAGDVPPNFIKFSRRAGEPHVLQI